MSTKNGIHKVRNNGLLQPDTNINRDFLVKQDYPKGTTFLNIEKLKKMGQNLNQESEVTKREELPRKFFDIGKIDL